MYARVKYCGIVKIRLWFVKRCCSITPAIPQTMPHLELELLPRWLLARLVIDVWKTGLYCRSDMQVALW